MAFDGIEVMDFTKVHPEVARRHPEAERIFVNLVTNVDTKNIQRFTRHGDEKISIPAACLEDDCIMNGILYPAEVIAEAMSYSLWSFIDAPVCYNHPEDDQGRFMSARSPDGQAKSYIGGSYENVERRKNSGAKNDGDKMRVWGDAVFDVTMIQATPNGPETLARIAAKKPIGMSIGIYLDVVAKPNATDHDYEALWIQMDHFAVLPEGVKPASTTKQGTGMFVPNRVVGGNPTQLRMLTCNMATPTSIEVPPSDSAGNPAPDPALAGNSDALDKGVLTKLIEALSLHLNRGKAAPTEDDNMSDTATQNSELASVINAAVKLAVNEAMDARDEKLPEIVANAVKDEMKPILEVNEATAKANAEAAAKAKAEAVEKVVALNALPKEAAEVAPMETLNALIANAEANKGSATAANRSGDGGAATNAYSEADLDAELAVGNDSKEG